jgi:hypothetical protein
LTAADSSGALLVEPEIHWDAESFGLAAS